MTINNQSNNNMEAITKLRSMTQWYDYQSEYLNERFKSVAQLEQAYDYAAKHDLAYIDDDYLSSLEPEEAAKHFKFLKQLTK